MCYIYIYGFKLNATSAALHCRTFSVVRPSHAEREPSCRLRPRRSRPNAIHHPSTCDLHPPDLIPHPALARELPPHANASRIVLLRLARRPLAPRVPEDEERERRERDEHAEHRAEQRARVHVRVRADEAERRDGDGEGQDRPEQRGEREREETRERRQAAGATVVVVVSGMRAEAEVLALLGRWGWGLEKGERVM